MCHDIWWTHPLFCGKRGIRTPGTVARTPHFECGPIDHSGTSPFRSREEDLPRSPDPKPLFWDCKYRHIFYFSAFSCEKNFSPQEKMRLWRFVLMLLPNNFYLCIRRTSAVLLRSGRLYGENDTKSGMVFVYWKRTNANTMCAMKKLNI